MVGTRHPTPSGSGMAERLACDLAAQGLVITSGMAGGATRPATAARSRQKAKPSWYSAPVLM
ncbi:MAG: DNA-processing protein DprA [Candidatus Sulfotelmatobacter sp.]